MKYSVEKLIHFSCDCGKWFSIGDAPLDRPFFCPWCGLESSLHEKEQAKLAGVSMYRLLKKGEQLKSGDEFLNDDCATWSEVPSLFLKCKHNPYVLMPVRRPVSKKGRVSLVTFVGETV